MKKKIKNLIFGSIMVIALIFVAIVFSGKGNVMSMDEKRDEFILQKQDIQGELLSQGNYTCCLEKPCTYCIEKTPGHGEGAACTCLEDVVNGVHPCGECIGEILEGHGNPYLKEYFAEAIAEEVGEQHLETIKQIIEEKYPD
jgi:hypothetical protein